MSKVISIEDFQPDLNNFNSHTSYGMHLLEKSVEKVGVIESITVSSDDVVISGNARQEVFAQKFEGVEPIVVESDGTRPVIIKRKDIKSGTKHFHEAALLANTVSKANVNLDEDIIKEVAVEEYGIDVQDLGYMIQEVKAENNEEENQLESKLKLTITFETLVDKEALEIELIERGFNVS